MKKIYMFKNFLLFTCIYFGLTKNSLANTQIPLIQFEINTNDVLEKFELTLMNPKNYLENFVPKGIVIKERKVIGNKLSFKATKKVLLVTKTLLVIGFIDYKKESTRCSKLENGYELNIDFQPSERLVYENLKGIVLHICLKNISENKAKVAVKGEMIDGDVQLPILNKIIKSTILDQINPILY